MSSFGCHVESSRTCSSRQRTVPCKFPEVLANLLPTTCLPKMQAQSMGAGALAVDRRPRADLRGSDRGAGEGGRVTVPSFSCLVVTGTVMLKLLSTFEWLVQN
jgi:hypothetical protein